MEPPAVISTPQKQQLPIRKIAGFSLLIIGLLMVIIPIILIGRVFTGVSKPPQVVNVEAPTLSLPSLGDSIEIPAQLQSQGFSLKQKGNAKQPKIIPDEVFNLYINSGFFYLFMIFVTSSGSKVANIGINLSKDLKVKN